jgi:hypothetical protein
MPQLKPSFLQEIKQVLGRSKFTTDDFEFEHPDNGQSLIRITFVHKPEYSFMLYEQTKEESIQVEQKYLGSTRTERSKYTVLSAKVSPGNFKTVDMLTLSEPGEILEHIPKWCENIRKDLYALAPRKDPLDELRAKMKAKLDGLVHEQDDYFNEDELTVVDTRFDQLYQEITNLRDEYDLTKQQLDELQKEFQEFKNSARVYPKGIWARVTGNKLVKATGSIFNSSEGRSLIMKGISKALGMDDAS